MMRFGFGFLVACASALRIGAPATRPGRAAPRMHCNIYPRFTIKDYAAAKPLMDECVAATSSEAGCIYYGWTVSEDKTELRCRETYVDGKAAAAHLQNAVPIVGKMLDSGCVALDSIGAMGTKQDLADIKEEGDKLGMEYWETWDDFDNFKKSSSESSETQGFLTIQPTFTLVDQAKAEPLMKECVEATRAEKGCVYYGWTIKGDKLFCREAYVDGKAVDEHLANAVPIVGKMLDSGCVTLDAIELHGPKAEWAACKKASDELGMKYYDVDASFSKFGMPKFELFGMKF